MLVSGSSPKTVASIGPKRAYSTAASSTASLGAVRHKSSRKRSSAVAIADPSYIQRLPTHCCDCPPRAWTIWKELPYFLGQIGVLQGPEDKDPQTAQVKG